MSHQRHFNHVLSTAHRRRSLALIVTLLIIVLLVAATSRMATTAATASIRRNIRANTLQHELAVDSILRIAADLLQDGSEVMRDLRRNGVVSVADQFGNCRVRCRVVSDAGKLNVTAFSRSEDRPLLRRKLIRLRQRLDLPDVEVQLRPIRERRIKVADGRHINLPAYASYDQLFGRRSIDGLFGLGTPGDGDGRPDSLAWSDVITLYGDGRVDLRYVDVEVLGVLLEDVASGAARKLIDHRQRVGERMYLTAALTSVPEPTRDKIRKRLGLDIQRYAFTIDTAVDNDKRRWYVVAEAVGGKIDKMHYRGRITW